VRSRANAGCASAFLHCEQLRGDVADARRDSLLIRRSQAASAEMRSRHSIHWARASRHLLQFFQRSSAGQVGHLAPPEARPGPAWPALVLGAASPGGVCHHWANRVDRTARRRVDARTRGRRIRHDRFPNRATAVSPSAGEMALPRWLEHS
jgi:hypothetical protein